MSRRKKTLLLIFLGLVAFPAGAGLVVRQRVERDWAELNERVDGIQAEVLAQGMERPVLHGAALEGEAFAHYERALELSDGSGQRMLRASLADVEQASEEELAARAIFLESMQPVLAELRLGAQARRAELDIDWESEERHFDWGVDLPVFFTVSARFLSRVAFQASLTELTQGRPEEALLYLLDSLQLARDLAATPLLTESQAGIELLVPGPLQTFGAQGGWSRFPSEVLARWIDALAIVDADLATIGDALRVDTVLRVRSLETYLEQMQAGPFRWNLPLGPVVALVGSGLKAKANDSHQLLLDFEREHAAAFESDPVRGPYRVRTRYRALARRAGGYAEVPFRKCEEASVARLTGLARLRLLRHALCLEAGRADAPATDRLGLPIQSEIVDGQRRVFLDPGHGAGIEIRLPLAAESIR